MCVSVCVCVCVCVCECMHRCVYVQVGVVFVDVVDWGTPLTMSADVCQCCCVLTFICLPLLKTLSLLLNLVNKQSDVKKKKEKKKRETS